MMILLNNVSFSKLANFYDKQLEATEKIKDYDYILYGGAAGGGKSRWLRWMAIGRLLYFAQKGLRNVRVGLFCETYTALDDRQLSKVQFEFPTWLGDMNMSKREFHLKPQYGSGVLCFRNLDDPSKYLSSEFADILIDELTTNKRDIFDFLVGTRMRWPGIQDSKFMAATNPGGVGHGWVKKLWIDRNFEDEKLDPNSFCFISSLYTDNPYIDHVSYGKRLASLPDALRRAYMEGDWDIFAGQFFTEFRRNVHVIEPFTDEDTLNWFNALPTYCGLDYGYSPHYSAVLWAKYYEGIFYIYRELYIREKTYEELKQLIIDIEIPKIIYADPSIWAKKDSPTSGADKMKPLPLVQAMNDRLIGWNIVKQSMKTNHLKIFSTCKNLIRTIPDQVYNERLTSQAEDLDTEGEDHLPDALRYLQATHKNIKPQKEALNYSKKPSKVVSKFGGELDQLFAPRKSNNYSPRYRR